MQRRALITALLPGRTDQPMPCRALTGPRDGYFPNVVLTTHDNEKAQGDKHRSNARAGVRVGIEVVGFHLTKLQRGATRNRGQCSTNGRSCCMTGSDLGHSLAGSPDADDVDSLDAGEPLKVGQGKKECRKPAVGRAWPTPSSPRKPEVE